ncbi:MAG: hypothetical protein ABIJ56_01230, partial [Pseudomonadota bacterium]
MAVRAFMEEVINRVSRLRMPFLLCPSTKTLACPIQIYMGSMKLSMGIPLMMSKPAFNFLVLAAVIHFVACGTSAKDNACEPGRTVSCACGAGVEGTQTCLGDGSGWDVCQCPSPDADVEEDVDMEIDDVAAEDGAAEDLAAEDGVDTYD